MYVLFYKRRGCHARDQVKARGVGKGINAHDDGQAFLDEDVSLLLLTHLYTLKKQILFNANYK